MFESIALILFVAAASCAPLGLLCMALSGYCHVWALRYACILRDRWHMKIIRLPSGLELVSSNVRNLAELIQADNDLRALRRCAAWTYFYARWYRYLFRACVVLVILAVTIHAGI
jgi:hypothetical protein